MDENIRTLTFPLPFRMGFVNCYLVDTGSGFVLIDTAGSKNRKALLAHLASAGCGPSSLKLVVLTHGDFDHTGNAAFLKRSWNVKVALHPGDSDMVEHADMFAGRKKPALLIRLLLPIFTGFNKADRFVPDILMQDGMDLSVYGLTARVISIPGHSKGSAGILTDDLVLFCGDLFENTREPMINPLMDDQEAAEASINKLSGMQIEIVYPGHGKPFPLHAVRSGFITPDR